MAADLVPPPWKYNVKTSNKWDSSHIDPRSNYTFLTKAERFPAKEPGVGQAKAVPGPGAYDPKPSDGFLKQQATVECFGSKQSRFGTPSVTSVLPTPGPGQYDTANADALIKRSFNITVG